jgi:hypothetical protein
MSALARLLYVLDTRGDFETTSDHKIIPFSQRKFLWDAATDKMTSIRTKKTGSDLAVL